MLRRLPSNLIYAVTTAGLAVLALAAAVLLDTAWTAFALALAGLAVSWSQHRMDGLAENRVPRALALAALAVTAGAGAAGVAAVLAVGIVAVERLVHTALHTDHTHTANMDVRRSLAERAAAPRTAFAAVTVYTGIAAAGVAFTAGPGWAWPGWAALAAGFTLCGGFALALAAAWLRRRRSAHSGDPAVFEQVERLQPKFIIHFSGMPRSEYQMLMWLEHFDALGDPYLIVMRERTCLDGIAAATDTPIAVVPSISQIERLLVPSVKAVFYVNNSMYNTQLVRFGHLTHVQLMHGDSDKAVSRNPVSAMYDLVFVAGQAGIDRYHQHQVDIPEHKFRKVGRPQLHPIEVGPRTGGQGTVVLYTPTWTGMSSDVNYSSLRIGRKIVSELLSRDVAVHLRHHPYTGNHAASARQLREIEALLEADAEATGRPHRWGAATSGSVTLADCVNAADAAISDVSGAASDWLYSGKPFAVTDTHGLGDRFCEQFPLARAAYTVDSDAANIAEVVDELLHTDSKAAVRAETRTYYLGDAAPEDCAEVFLKAARDCYA